MSKRIRGGKRAPISVARPNNPQKQSSAIRASVRAPISHAAMSVASVMLASNAVAQQSGTQLPTIDVVGDNKSYQTTNQTIQRLPAPLRDTPQTVNVVPQAVIQDQRMTTM